MSGKRVDGAGAASALFERLTGRRDSRVAGCLVLAPHPDDETLGASWALTHAAAPGVVYLTDGAPQDRQLWPDPAIPSREAYARLRRREAEAALATAAVGPERVWWLDAPDQGASDRLVPLTRVLARLLAEVRPGWLLTPAYEGGHPDHDAAAFAARAACARVAAAGGSAPALIEIALYHAGDGHFVTGEFLPSDRHPTETVVLSDRERRVKIEMLECHRSQTEALREFKVGAERYREAPQYDFERPPHPGVLHYERMGWGMTGAGWRDRVRAASAELALSPP